MARAFRTDVSAAGEEVEEVGEVGDDICSCFCECAMICMAFVLLAPFCCRFARTID